MEEKVHTYRSMPEERKYLNKHWNGSFTNFVRDSFKYNIDLTKDNRKKNRLQKYGEAIVLLSFGAIFLFLTTTQRNLLGMIMVLLLGVFFTATGLSTLYYDRKEKKKL